MSDFLDGNWGKHDTISSSEGPKEEVKSASVSPLCLQSQATIFCGEALSNLAGGVEEEELVEVPVTVTETFWVNSSRVIPLLTIQNVHLIYFLNPKCSFLGK